MTCAQQTTIGAFVHDRGPRTTIDYRAMIMPSRILFVMTLGSIGVVNRVIGSGSPNIYHFDLADATNGLPYVVELVRRSDPRVQNYIAHNPDSFELASRHGKLFRCTLPTGNLPPGTAATLPNVPLLIVLSPQN